MTLKKTINKRDGCTSEEADELIQGMINQVMDGEDPDEVLQSEGFEPDYVFDLLEGL